MPKVEFDRLPTYSGPGRVSAVLGPLGPFEGRAISAAHGLRHLGANVETLMPGSASSHRHWHDRVDEILVVLEGDLTLVEEAGETALSASDIAVFSAGTVDGHCLRNDSDLPARFFVVSSRDPQDSCHYADADLVAAPDGTLRRADGRMVGADGAGP